MLPLENGPPIRQCRVVSEAALRDAKRGPLNGLLLASILIAILCV
jgi:hypothetical protein